MISNIVKSYSKTLSQTLKQNYLTSINITQNTTPQSQNTIQVLSENDLKENSSIHEIQKNQLKISTLDWQYQSNQATLLAYNKAEEKPEKQTRSIRNLAAKCARNLQSRKLNNCDIAFPESFSQTDITEFLNAFYLSNYQFKLEKEVEQKENEPSKKFQPIESLNVLNSNFELEDAEAQFRLISAKAALYARELGNQRANVGTTEYFLDVCQNLVKEYPGLEIEYIKGEDLDKKGLRLHYAVGKASINPPIAINLTYKGNPDSEEYISLVGKGLTFDAGGLNIKPTGFMETMYMDKQGACNVIAILKGALESKLKLNLTCSVGLAENFISNNSYRPSDIITAYNGLTVEIGNTDAEGRLVLADVICWTNDLHKDKITKMIEFSTLTGACVVALGEKTAGVFSNSDSLANDIIKSGKQTSEQLWRLPVFDDHREAMKGDFSDLSNSGKDRYGGSSKAAAFLERFFNEKSEWCHIDIAGPADTKAQNGVYSAGSTGFGVETILNYLKQQQQN